MGLEQKVRQEVDSWDISVRCMNGKPVNYERLIKPIYYGMGIAVTEKGIELYKDNIIPKDQVKIYTSRKFDEAVEEFKKDLIIYQYLKEGTAKGTARVLSAGSNEDTGRVILCQILKRNGLTFREISANPERFRYTDNISEFKIDDSEVIFTLDGEIRVYSEIIKPRLFQKLILENSQNMATRFSLIAKNIVQEENPIDSGIQFREYENMPLEEALEQFKANYLRQQFIESGYNGKLAAERSGISYNSYKEHMSRRKISMRELKKENNSS